MELKQRWIPYLKLQICFMKTLQLEVGIYKVEHIYFSGICLSSGNQLVIIAGLFGAQLLSGECGSPFADGFQ
jgi:hypothetical protein